MEKISLIVLVLITIILTGCSPRGVRHTAVNMGDGTTAMEIDCSGHYRSRADCRNHAAKLCNGKYKELDKEESNSNRQNFYTGQLTVVCK
jgi:hypothetical protein